MMENFAGRMDIDPETGAPRSTYLQAQHPLQQNLLNIRAKEKMKSNQVILYLRNQ